MAATGYASYKLSQLYANYCFHNLGAPADKLILGLAFYGRSFTLADPQQNSFGSPIAGAGTAGPYTREAGFMGYNEICSLVDLWNRDWSGSNKVPYIYNGNQWIGYDNEESIGLKVEFANAKNLGGVMIWSIETDDFRGKCGGTKYPLLNTINSKLGNTQSGGGNESTTTIPPPCSSSSAAPTASTTSTTTTVSPVQPLPTDCSIDGFFSNPVDCSRFYQCVGGVRYDFKCNAGLYFDKSISTCNWPELVQCNI